MKLGGNLGGGKFVGGKTRGGGIDKLGTEKLPEVGGTVDVILLNSGVDVGAFDVVIGVEVIVGGGAVDREAIVGGFESSWSPEPGRGGGVPGELGSESSYNAAGLSYTEDTC